MLLLSTLISIICVTLTIEPINSQPCSKEDKVLIHQRTTFVGQQATRLAHYTDIVNDLGYTWDIASDSDWSAMSTTDFAQYRAILFLDGIDNDFGYYFLALAASTANVWSPAIDGNILIIGSDESHHYDKGGSKLIENGLKFVLDDTCDKTGLYMSLSYYYYPLYSSGGGLPTTVNALSYFGTFIVDHHNTVNSECHDNSHIVASHPVFTGQNGLSDDDISNWECSVHEIFIDYPTDFVPLAIGESVEGYATGFAATLTYLDGTSGVPYILVRGDSVVPDPLLPSYCVSMENDVCTSEPCSCSEVDNCNVCNNGQGCSQCQTGYFRIDNNHNCVLCDMYIEGCTFCQDFNGCGQCQQGWTRKYDNNCGYWSCTPDINPTTAPTAGNTVILPSEEPSEVPTSAPSVAPTQGCGVGCDTARGCSRVYNIECDMWYCDCPCKEKISVYYLDITNNWRNYDIDQYLGDYYFTGYASYAGSIDEYPVYQHANSDAYFSLLGTHGWTYVQFNIIEVNWFFYGTSNNGFVNDNWEIFNQDSNPFDGNYHENEWIVRGYNGVHMTASFDDCSNEGINFAF